VAVAQAVGNGAVVVVVVVVVVFVVFVVALVNWYFIFL
jgi:hypothetical protein